jgi:precorrin-8X/cobalt-precorrin-8 methylmutase
MLRQTQGTSRSEEVGGVVTLPNQAPAVVSPVTDESYRILRARIDLSRLPKHCRDVTERVIHASADFDYFTDLVCDEESLADGVAALAAGAPVIADSVMVAAGITGCPVLCKINEPLTQRLARTAAITRAAAAVRLGFGEAGPGAVWVVGGGSAALAEILSRRVEPAFVVGLPVGFVGAAEAKDALRASGLRSLSNVSEKGGPTVAVAAFNALLESALTVTGSRAGWGPDGQAAVADDDGAGW